MIVASVCVCCMTITKLRSAGPRLAATIATAVTIGLTVASAASPGEQHRWSLEFRARLDQPGGQRQIEIYLSGDWVSTISAVRPGEYDAELEVALGRFTGAGLASPAAGAAEQFRRRMSRPFWATYRDDGALITIHFFKDVEPSDRNLLQMIATEIQLVRPDASRPQWTAFERDGAGGYLALYDQPEPRVVVKRKLKYVHTDGVAGAPRDRLQVAVDHSEFRFALDPDGGILAMDGTDRVLMGVPLGKTEQLTATVETHLANPRRSRAPELIGSLVRARPGVVNFPIETHKTDPEAARAQLDARLLDGHTTESLLQAAISKSDDHMLSERLAALFRRRPEATLAAVAILRKSGPQKQITSALAVAGSLAAMEGLGSLARDPAAPASVRVDALTALVRLQHPDIGSMHIPMTLLDDPDPQVESAARMISGAIARAGRAEHPADADAIDAALIARYRKAQDVRDLSDLLAALGNSVGPSTLPVIKEALGDPREPLRATAARALRLAVGPEIDRLLSEAMTSDYAPGVRAEAVLAASFRRPLGFQLGEALLSVASADPVESVRSRAITLLRQNPSASPRIAETLAWIADNDAKPGVRRLAREALVSVSAGASR